MSRSKRWIQGSIVGSAMLFSGAGTVSAEEITVTSFGGIWETAITNCFAAEYEKRTGHKANVMIGSPAQWMSQIEANPDNPPIDVIVSTQSQTVAAGEGGLISRAGPNEIPNLADVDPLFIDAVDGWGGCFDFGSFVIAYNKDTVKNPPKSLKEFMDRTIAGDWVASFPSITYAIMPDIIWSFAELYGGSADNVDPAFEIFKKIKASGNAIAWASVTDFLNQMSTGDADIGMYWDGRAYSFIDKGNDWMGVITPTDKAYMSCVAMNKSKGAPDAAWEYLNIVFEAGPQSCFSDYLNYGVTNQKVQYSEKMKNRVTWPKDLRAPSTATSRKIAENAADWIERWNKEIGL